VSRAYARASGRSDRFDHRNFERSRGEHGRAPILEDALGRLEEASIGTIHSFCAQILRERPVEAVVDPAFEELSDQQAGRIYERAFRAWFQEELGQGAPGLRRALLRLAWRDSWEKSPPIEQLEYAGWKLIEWRDHPAPWRRVMFDRRGKVDGLIEQVRLIAEAASRSKRSGDNLVRSLRPAQALVTWIDRAEAATRARDYDTLESLLIKLLRDLKPGTRVVSHAFHMGDWLPEKKQIVDGSPIYLWTIPTR